MTHNTQTFSVSLAEYVKSVESLAASSASAYPKRRLDTNSGLLSRLDQGL